MQIEVLVGDGEPKTYNLEKSKLVLGSGEGCDIIINAPSVSRKHAILTTENGEYFITDQGSTNGTYLNDKRLPSGVRFEVLTILPLRLGDDVLITLYSDLELSAEEITPIEKTKPQIQINKDFEERTRVVSLSNLQTAKTETLVKRRQELKKNAPKKVAKKKKKEISGQSIMIGLVAAILIAYAAYQNIYVHQQELEEAEAAEAARVAEEKQKRILAKKKAIEKPSFLVPLNSLTAPENYSSMFAIVKCSSEIELPLCEALPQASRENGFGALQVGPMMHVFLNGASYLNEAKILFTESGNPQPADEDLYRVATLIFLSKDLNSNFNFPSLDALDVTFVFYDVPEGSTPLYKFSAAVKGSKLQEFRTMVHPDQIQSFKNIGLTAFTYTKDYLLIY